MKPAFGRRAVGRRDNPNFGEAGRQHVTCAAVYARRLQHNLLHERLRGPAPGSGHLDGDSPGAEELNRDRRRRAVERERGVRGVAAHQRQPKLERGAGGRNNRVGVRRVRLGGDILGLEDILANRSSTLSSVTFAVISSQRP